MYLKQSCGLVRQWPVQALKTAYSLHAACSQLHGSHIMLLAIPIAVEAWSGLIAYQRNDAH